MINDIKTSNTESISEQNGIPAGDFSSWLSTTRSLFIKETGATVDCGECKGCCTSSYFIHIRPEETKTRAHIDKKLMFPAPGLPKGNMLLGFFENGYCPMMIDDRCSIYEYRPITCRNYDCRIFTAAGIDAGDEDKALINERVHSWRFSYPTKSDRDQHLAVQAAAMFLKNNADCFPAGSVPANPSQLAILAIKVYEVFLNENGEFVEKKQPSSNTEIAEAIVALSAKFEAQRSNR